MNISSKLDNYLYSLDEKCVVISIQQYKLINPKPIEVTIAHDFELESIKAECQKIIHLAETALKYNSIMPKKRAKWLKRQERKTKIARFVNGLCFWRWSK